MGWMARQSEVVTEVLSRTPAQGIASFWSLADQFAVMSVREGVPCPAAIAVMRHHALCCDRDGIARMRQWARSSLALERLHAGALSEMNSTAALATSVLDHVLSHPGCEQTRLVFVLDRAPSKVRRICKEMADAGLLHREPHGATYRLWAQTPQGPCSE